MTIVAPGPVAATVRAHFVPVLWPDDHPDRLALGRQLPSDHLARQIDDAVADLDLTAVRGCYHGTGSDPHPPELLVRAVLYEAQCGRHSPAQWYTAAADSGPVRWLLRGCQPARSCWYAFRDRIAPLLQALNRQPVVQAIAAGLTPATRGAGDGTLVAANASRHRLLNEAALTKRTLQLEAAVTADGAGATAPAPPVSAAAAPAPPASAAAAPTPAPPAPKWMATQPTGRQRQLKRYQQAQQQMLHRQTRNRGKLPSKRTDPTKLVVSASDPAAAIGLDKEKVFRPLYNVQIVDDLDSPFILGYDVFAQPNDAGLLAPLLARVRDLVGHALQVVLTDTGYTGGADLQAANLAGTTVYAPLPKETTKQLPKSAFTWLADAQTYQCPQGHRLELEATGKMRHSSPEAVVVQRFRCPPVHCTACPLRQQCAQKPVAGRTISRSEYEPEVEALRERMAQPATPPLYRLRKQTVELVNADWKEHRRLRRFSGRGLPRVRCQVGLVVLAHNLVTLLAEQAKAKAAARVAGSPSNIAR
jgi:transposase